MNQDEFTTELQHIVAQARDARVSLAGTHDVRSPRRDVPDYTIEITQIAE